MIARFSKHLYIALLLLVPLISCAQFPTAVGTKWEYFQFWDDIRDVQAVRNAFEDEVVGDTLAGGNTYQIVRRTGSMYNAFSSSILYDDVSGTYYYRVAGSQVWLLDSVHLGTAYESILYDFGLTVGDSTQQAPRDIINLTPGGNEALYLKTYNYDTVCLVYGQCYTDFVLESYVGNPWIGPSLTWAYQWNMYFLPHIGIVFSQPYMIVLDVQGQYYYLKRLTSNGQVLYRNPVLAAALDPSQDLALLEMYPNPATDEVQIQSTSLITNVQIVDVTGRVLANITVAASQASLDLSQYPPGTYALVAQVDGKSVSRKLVLH
jgi:hypothetical protein